MLRCLPCKVGDCYLFVLEPMEESPIPYMLVEAERSRTKHAILIFVTIIWCGKIQPAKVQSIVQPAVRNAISIYNHEHTRSLVWWMRKSWVNFHFCQWPHMSLHSNIFKAWWWREVQGFSHQFAPYRRNCYANRNYVLGARKNLPRRLCSRVALDILVGKKVKFSLNHATYMLEGWCESQWSCRLQEARPCGDGSAHHAYVVASPCCQVGQVKGGCEALL